MTETTDDRANRMKRRGEVKASLYKTTLCQFFRNAAATEKEGREEQPRRCPFGDRCAFAHGESELRTEEENIRLYWISQQQQQQQQQPQQTASEGDPPLQTLGEDVPLNDSPLLGVAPPLTRDDVPLPPPLKRSEAPSVSSSPPQLATALPTAVVVVEGSEQGDSDRLSSLLATADTLPMHPPTSPLAILPSANVVRVTRNNPYRR